MGWQDVAVTVIVVAAALGFARVVLGSFGLGFGKKRSGGCANCPAATAQKRAPSAQD